MSINLIQFLLDSYLFADKLTLYLVRFMADKALYGVFARFDKKFFLKGKL
jgi:hypothetical protein